MNEAKAATVADPIPSKQDFANIGRGLLMGGADVIPGVSGGTVALIVGIYQRLVTAISHVDSVFVSHVVKREFKEAAQRIDLRLVIPLGIGILSGVVALGSVMHTLLEDHRQLTMAAFFGMIAASSYLVAKLIEKWTVANIALIVAGAAFALFIVTLKATETPPDGLWYVFLCGAIAICAMILPGISGAFILLILGKYHEITGIIKEVIKLKLSLHSIATVVVFAIGCLVGLLAFARILKWLLSKYWQKTMSVLCGFMLGSLYKIWPFQVDTTPLVEEFKHKRFEPIPLNEISFDGMFWMTILITIVAASLVLLLDFFGTRKESLHEMAHVDEIGEE